MHGIGLYTWKDKKFYEGEYVNDKKEGFGKYSWPDGRVYKGYWKDGKQHGLGEYTVSVGDKTGSSLKKQTRYGMWIDGSRTKWFPVSREFDLDTQLNAIEESLI